MAADLFGIVDRGPRLVRMHAIDAGNFPDGKPCAEFKCRKCGGQSGWVYASKQAVRTGIPCEQCNDRPARARTVYSVGEAVERRSAGTKRSPSW